MIKFIPLLFLSGCQIHAGLAVHPAMDNPEYSGTNPIGVVRFTQRLDETDSLELEHRSSIPDTEEGYGFNTLTYMKRLK